MQENLEDDAVRAGRAAVARRSIEIACAVHHQTGDGVRAVTAVHSQARDGVRPVGAAVAGPAPSGQASTASSARRWSSARVNSAAATGGLK
jgi:hypothetical protein